MTMQAMASFVEKAQQDPELADELVSIIDQNDTDASYSKVVALANNNGFAVTVDDVMETRQQFEKMPEGGYQGDVSDDELDNVSGGIASVVQATGSPLGNAATAGAVGVRTAAMTSTAIVQAADLSAAGARVGGGIASAVTKRGVNDFGSFIKKW